MHPRQHSKNRSRVWVWAEALLCLGLAALGAWLIFGGLGSATFHDGDEALYATVARQMGATHDWLTPWYWNDPFLHKPPLMYWLISASCSLLTGCFEFQARFPSALAGLVLLAMVYWTARRLGGVLAGAGAALLLLLNHQFLFEHCVRSANLDSLLTTLMFSALVFGACSHRNRAALCASSICLAGVLMVKAPLAIFVVPPVFVLLRFQGRTPALRWLGWSTLGVAVLALPWHIYAFWAHGAEFWDIYVIYEMVGRIGASTLRAPGTTAWIPLHAFWQSFLPWSPLLIAALAAGLIGSPGNAAGRAERRLLATYSVSILGLFCLLPSKWPWYGLPAYPALAVLGAVFASDLLRSNRRWITPLMLALLLTARLLLLQVNHSYDPAARAGWAWPGQAQLYLLSPASVSWLTWAAAIGALMLAALPLLRPFRARVGLAAGASLAIAVVLFGMQTRIIASVPREHECATRKLVRTLEERSIDRLLTMAFTRDANYGDRQKPLTSVYFLGIRGAEVEDCGRRFDCLDSATGRTALVVPTSLVQSSQWGALLTKLRTLAATPEVWVLDPESEDRFERLTWR